MNVGKKLDINYYKQQRDYLRKYFENEKTGEQDLLYEQTKLFQPLINSQTEIKDRITESQNATSNMLVPFTQEIQRRNDLVETSQYLPFYNAPLELETAKLNVPQSTPEKPTIYVDFDKDLNITDRENLQDLSLHLPSKVQQAGSFEQTLKTIKLKNQEIGQYLGKASKKEEREKIVYESQKQTLKKYKNIIKNLQGAEPFVTKTGKGVRNLCKLKRARGRPKKHPDVIVCNSVDELVYKLREFITAKEAGNTGLDNYIISILDELLRIKAISKDYYDNVHKNIFN